MLAFVLTLVCSLIKSLRRKCNSFAMCTLSLAIVSAGLFVLLGPEGLPVIPASIVREGIMQPRMHLDTVNYALIAFALGGWVLTLFTTRYER